MGRNIVGIIVGSLFAFAVILVVQIIGTIFFPLPQELNGKGSEALQQYIADGAPFSSLLFASVGFAFSTFIGGIVAGGIALSEKRIMAMGVAIVWAIIGISLFIRSTFPLWFFLLTLVLILVSGYLAGRTIDKKKTS